MTNAARQSYVRTDVRYRDVNQHAGEFQGLRFYHADGVWLIDAERADGTLSEQHEYVRPDTALNEMPLLFAVLVLGVQVRVVKGDTQPDQAQAPAQWHVHVPIPDGGTEVSVHRNRLDAENYIRLWMRSV
jgi:hypothetical protein